MPLRVLNRARNPNLCASENTKVYKGNKLKVSGKHTAPIMMISTFVFAELWERSVVLVSEFNSPS
jgi:hypothetical protein